MASSRRLDISSLLCDDDQPAFSPLDALVQAATQERRRLDASSTSNYHQTYHPRLHDTHHHHPASDPDPDRGLLDRTRDDDRRTRVDYDRPVHDHHHHQHHQKQSEYEYHVQEQQLREQDHLRELEHQQRLRHEQREREQRQIERERQERERDRFLLHQQQHQHQLHQQQHLLLQQQQQQQQQHAADLHREQERLDLLHRQHRPQPSLPASRSPSISHLISHTPHRHPDPLQISPILPIAHIVSAPVPSPVPHPDQPPIKKRRYSESPTRPFPDDRERIARDRDKMFVGELGYGRVETPVAGPSYPPRRPGSGHGPSKKPVSVSDLLADKEPQRPHSREAETHRVVSPLGRRSPPGSQIGRAKAARKSDEHLFRDPPPVAHIPLEPQELRKSPKEDLKIKQEPKHHHPRPRTSSFVDDTRPKKLLKESAPPPPPPLTAPSQPSFVSKIHTAKPQQDAHEWFLQHYDEDLSPPTSARPEPPHTPSPSLSPVTPAHPPPPLVSVKISPVEEKPPLTPITSAVVSLEQELEDLVSESTTTTAPSMFVKKQEPKIDIDLDVDLAVTELVDNMEEDIDVKRESIAVEADVEDELLSLIDDRPPPPPPPPVSARRAPGSAASSSHGSAVTPLAATVSLNANAKPTPTPSLPERPVPEAKQTSPPIMSTPTGSVSVLSSTSAARQTSSTRPTSDRESMPPPASVSGSVSKASVERAGSAAPAATPAAKKKKEPAAKAAPKTKSGGATTATTTKAKAKPAVKPKKGTPSEIVAPPPSATASAALSIPPPAKMVKTMTGRKAAPSTSVSRSRSASVMPASMGPESDSVKAEKQEEEEESEEEKEDDKLYCVCKTKYDEDRFMIACDRCDEWYHTQCVHMPDLEVDLVDQFICPPCVEKNPHLNLRTTYKTRCLYGLRHPDPSSTKACHKAARGAFSKYCSDECGVKYMQSRIDNWQKKGGKTEKLWESVKNAEKREGVVVCAAEPDPEPTTNGCAKTTESSGSKPEESVLKPKKQHIVPPKRSRVEQETDRLTTLLDSVIKLREEIKRDMEVVGWRERLLKLATDRAEAVGQCGWDQRLCMDDEEWADIGDSVFESYDDAKAVPVKEESADGDVEAENPEEQWWCPGKVVCDRHAGWQTVRSKDVAKEKAKMEEALEKLTTREREIRKNIEDMLDSQATTGSTTSKNTHVKETGSSAPLKSANTKAVNGNPKSKTAATTGDAPKKGKKRKAPA